MKQLIIISSLFMLLFTGIPSVLKAQLITDSDSKLKTERKERKGGFFGLFKKDNKKPSSGPPQQSARSGDARSASGSPFAAFNKRKNATPRYSEADRGSLFRSKPTAPRYSSSGGLSFFNQKKRTTPRYSPGSPYGEEGFLSGIFSPDSGPRYSPESPFVNKKRMVSPRYSPGSPFNQSIFQNLFAVDKGPRYSPGSPFSQSLFRSLFAVDKGPRYSPAGSPFSKDQRTANPRYSPGSPFKEGLLTGIFSPDKGPRYSPGSPFEKAAFLSMFSVDKSPRYSPGSPFEGSRGKVKPLYSTNKNRFDVNELMKKQSRIDNTVTSRYKGSYKKNTEWYDNLLNLKESQITANYDGATKVPFRGDKYYKSKSERMAAYEGNYKEKWMNQRKMHPSAAHNNANFSQEWMRESLRKWNIFLTRVNRNKVQPDAVKDSVLKPKFDRKEAKIWYE